MRSGFNEAYNSKGPSERAALALRPHVHGADDPQKWAGLSQETAIIDWLHDCYFAAVAGDAPAFEAWPAQDGATYLHEYILGLWGKQFKRTSSGTDSYVVANRCVHRYATWRDVRPGEARKDVQEQKQMDVLLYVGTCELSCGSIKSCKCTGDLLRANGQVT